MKLTKIQPKSQVTFIPTHPATGEPLFVDEAQKQKVEIYVKSALSKDFRKGLHEVISTNAKNSKGKSPTFEKTERERAETLASAVVGWKNVLDDDDKQIPFTHEACVELFLNAVWLRQQADAFVGDDRNFFE